MFINFISFLNHHFDYRHFYSFGFVFIQEKRVRGQKTVFLSIAQKSSQIEMNPKIDFKSNRIKLFIRTEWSRWWLQFDWPIFSLEAHVQTRIRYEMGSPLTAVRLVTTWPSWLFVVSVIVGDCYENSFYRKWSFQLLEWISFFCFPNTKRDLLN